MPKKDRDHGSDADSDVEASKKDRSSSSSSSKKYSADSRSSRKKSSSTTTSSSSSSASSKDNKSSSPNRKHSQLRSGNESDVSSRLSGLLCSPFRQSMSLLRRIGPFPSLILGMLITWPLAFLVFNHTATTSIDDDSALWSASASLFTTPSSSLSSLNLPTSASSNSFNPSSKSLFQLRPYPLSAIEVRGSIAIIVSLHDEWNMLSQSLPNWLQVLGADLAEVVIVDWSRRRRHRQLSVRGNEALADSKLRQLLSSDDRIRLVHLYGNGGEAEYLNPIALNLAASLTSAKSLLHLTPDTLINEQQFLEAFPLQGDADGSAHNFYRGSLEHISDDSSTASTSTSTLRKRKMLRTPATDVPEMLRANFRWNFFVSRQAYWQIGGIDERFVGSEPPLNEEFRHFDNQDAPMHQSRASASKPSSTSPMPSAPSISSLTSSDEWHVGGNAHGSEILEFFDRLAQHEDADAPLLARASSPDDAIDRHEETDTSTKENDIKPLIERYFPTNALMQLESYAFIPASNTGEGSDVEAAPLVMENVFRLCAKTLPVWHEGLAYESRASSARFKVQVSGHESAVFLTRVEKNNPRLMHAFLQQGEASGVNGVFDQPLTPAFSNNQPSSNSHVPDDGAHQLLPTIPFHDLVPPSLQERFLLLSLHQFLFYDLHLSKKILAGLSMERMKRISKILQLLPISSEQQFHSAPSTSTSNAGSHSDVKLVHEAEGEAPLVPSVSSKLISEPKLLVLHVYGSATERLLTLESMEFLFRKLKLGHIRPRTASAAVAPSGPVPRQLVLVWPTDPASGCTVSYESLLQSHPFPVIEEYDPLMFQHTLFERFEFDDTSIVSMLRPESVDNNRLSSRTGDDGIGHPFPFNQFALDTEKHVYVRAKGALSIATKETIQQMQELAEAKKTLKFVLSKIAAIEKKPLTDPTTGPTSLSVTSPGLSEADKLKLLHLRSDLSESEGDVARLTQSTRAHRHSKGSDPASSLLSHSWHLSHLMPHRQVRKYVTHALLALSGVHLPMLSVESLFLNASYYRNHHAFGSAKTLVEQSGLHEEWSEWEKIMHQIPEKRIVAIHLESVHPAHLAQPPEELVATTPKDEVSQEAEVHVSEKPLNPHSFADDASAASAAPAAPATFASSVMELDNLLLRWALGQMDRELRVEPATVFYLTSYDTSSWIIQRLQNAYGDDKLVVNEAQGNRCHSLENVQNKWQLKWQQIHCAQLQLADAMVLRHASLILTNAPEHSGFIHLARRITLRDAQSSTPSSVLGMAAGDSDHEAGAHSHESAAAKLLHQHPKPTVRRMNLQKELETVATKTS